MTGSAKSGAIASSISHSRMERSAIRGFTVRMLSPNCAALHRGYKIGVRQKSNLLNGFKVIWVVQSHLQKYSDFPKPQITAIFRPSCPKGGAARDRHGRGTGCGGRGGALDELRLSGRRSRVVLMPRRWHQVLREDAQGDGGKKARLTGESTI
jgi:hypothetical protein